ncbi:hypothetical protein EV702DRAFT_1148570 [Suillus placidus]|uniref:ATP-dependent DNA helicase n=1 Tax=Suillus placidus TaxID=48579 RepID=A0A9P6ZHX0_9AGAM|nr:hypothetical protein EV702DRAFT_1148570 [Suillus placidus]
MEIHVCIHTHNASMKHEYTNFVDTVREDCSGARKSLQLIKHINNISDAVDFLFPSHVLDDPTTCLQHAFLSPRNVFVDEFNDIMLDALPGDYESYFSSNTLQ